MTTVDLHPTSPSAATATHVAPLLAVSVALCVVVAVVASAGPGRLPTLGWAAAFLFFAVESDLRSLRIPNALNGAGLLLALAGAAAGVMGLPSFAAALTGVAVAFALFFPAFAMGWLGAGDGKAAMVLGAIFGATSLLGLLWWAVVVGGLLAIALVAMRGELLDLVRRWGRTLQVLLATGHFVPAAPATGSAAASGLPFALALALGVISFEVWGVPWI